MYVAEVGNLHLHHAVHGHVATDEHITVAEVSMNELMVVQVRDTPGNAGKYGVGLLAVIDVPTLLGHLLQTAIHTITNYEFMANSLPSTTNYHHSLPLTTRSLRVTTELLPVHDPFAIHSRGCYPVSTRLLSLATRLLPITTHILPFTTHLLPIYYPPTTIY